MRRFVLGVCLAVSVAVGPPRAESAGPGQAVTATPRPTLTASVTPTPAVTPTPTPTLTATPTPALRYEDYFPATTGSKLGIHFLGATPKTYNILRTSPPPVIKLVGDVGWSAQARAEFPGMLIIGRLGNEEVDRLELLQMNPIRAARKFVEDRLEQYRRNPAIQYWEGWNEWTPDVVGSVSEWDWLTQFEGHRACVMREYGLRAVIGNFSTGRPEFGEMLLFVPALRAAAECGGLLGLHEYSAPTMQFGYGAGIPRRPSFPDRGILTLRYRFWYEDVLKPLDIRLPLVITELGVDGGVGAGRPGPVTGDGWLGFRNYWERQGLTTNSQEFYLSQLAWYDSEMRRDRYVIGAAIFTAGGAGTWESFDIDDIADALGQYRLAMTGR